MGERRALGEKLAVTEADEDSRALLEPVIDTEPQCEATEQAVGDLEREGEADTLTELL